MLHVHEVHKIVYDLIEQGAFELAHQITGLYMEHFDNTELRFTHLRLLAKMERQEEVLNAIEQSLDTTRWFSTWFLQRYNEFTSLESLPRYQELMRALKKKETDYWQQGIAGPITHVPIEATPPYPLLIALHGNGFNAQHSAENWSCAVQQGWLTTHPLSPNLVGYGLHWWDEHQENQKVVNKHVQAILKQFTVDRDRIVFGGFSKGGEVAMYLALQSVLQAKGFITVGAGGYFHMQPERWLPLLDHAPAGLRGVMMYSPYDLERVGDSLDQMLPQFDAHDIGYQLIKYDAAGHVFPADFDRRFEEALRFIFNPHHADRGRLLF